MRGYLILHIAALLTGTVLDWIIGDPHGIPHPVRGMGRLITALEGKLHDHARAENGRAQRDHGRERRRGTILWILVVTVTAVLTFALMAAAYLIHPLAYFAAETVMTCYMLAAGSLFRESLHVVKVLRTEGVDAARTAVAMIVGRDTGNMSEQEILMAATETVAENASDGVIAPLIYAAVGGPVLGYVYKAVNTMDSMLGYRNERYEHFGRTAARMDDLFNWLPARLSAMLMILAAFIAGLFSGSYNGKRAFLIWKRDRRNHLSPNSAQTESVCAGALGLQMGGTHLYGGVPVEKPTIGDRLRDPEQEDVRRVNVLMIMAEGILACLMAGAGALLAVMR